MSRSTWNAIFRLRQAREPLAWWKHALGAEYGRFLPFLMPCEGLAGQSYPCPDTGLHLRIRETEGRYRAFPVGEAAEDTADRELAWADVQAWRLNLAEVRRGLAGALGLMKAGARAKVAAAVILAGIAGMAAAGAAGFARTFAMPASGIVSLVNTQQNEVWRPCVVSVICPNVAERTVTIYRVAGALEYPIAQNTATARTYVYEFQANYWSGLSNGVKVTVRHGAAL